MYFHYLLFLFIIENVQKFDIFHQILVLWPNNYHINGKKLLINSTKNILAEIIENFI